MTTTALDKAKPTVRFPPRQNETNCHSNRQRQGAMSQFDTHLEGLGIPLRAPPLGDLRLKARRACRMGRRSRRDAIRASQPSGQDRVRRAQGSEDCLYLNVYRPGGATGSATLPVMMGIHGGGFVNGSGNAFYGAFLAQTANAIVVTVNYRLGPLGWLALPSLAAEAKDYSTGNYGLLDSIAALKWIKRTLPPSAAMRGG